MIIQKQNGELKENNNVLREQRGDALSQLNTLVEEKKALELDLYQKVFSPSKQRLNVWFLCADKFVDILNEKKKKIRELKKQGIATYTRWCALTAFYILFKPLKQRSVGLRNRRAIARPPPQRLSPK